MKIKRYVTIISLIFSISVYSSQENRSEINGAEKTAAEYFRVYDPWEGMNRRIYTFNYYFDRYFFIPVVETYRFITPDFAERRVTDFFGNLGQSSVMVNSLAQWKGRKFMRSLGRFSINSILGIFGFFDVATELDMPREYEDFGLTLARYGISDGPYIILPILGPSNLRDGTGTLLGFLSAEQIIPYNYIGQIDTTNPIVTGLQSIDARKRNSFRYYDTGSPFEYEYLRFFYREFRDLQIKGE
ncbi:MAG: MlaA family lipoprotein [Fusobacteriaceae bacterium]